MTMGNKLYDKVKKDSTVAVMLCLFFGGLGIHWFYMGRVTRGVFYLLFCWTFIPVVCAIIELFTISGTVKRYNQEVADLLDPNNVS